MDERKLLKFRTLKNVTGVHQDQKDRNAQNIRDKVIMVLSPMLEKIRKSDPEGAREVLEEQSKIQEEEKEREIGTFMKSKKDSAGQDPFGDKEDEEQEDELNTPILKDKPFLYFGFGINLYFDLLLTLMIAMAVISILTVPILNILSKRNNYTPDSWDVFTLGNMGFSAAYCSSSSLIADNFLATCGTGQITCLKYAELLPGNSENLSVCKPSNDTKACEGSFKKDEFISFFNTNCVNKQN